MSALSCSCRITTEFNYALAEYEHTIVYCPLHAAVDELLAALEDWRADYESRIQELDWQAFLQQRTVHKMLAAIAHATQEVRA